jgi:hypothetical protein
MCPYSRACGPEAGKREETIVGLGSESQASTNSIGQSLALASARIMDFNSRRVNTAASVVGSKRGAKGWFEKGRGALITPN